MTESRSLQPILPISPLLKDLPPGALGERGTEEGSPLHHAGRNRNCPDIPRMLLFSTSEHLWLGNTGYTNLQSLPLICFQPLRYKIPTTSVTGRAGCAAGWPHAPSQGAVGSHWPHTLAPEIRAWMREGWYRWSLCKPRNEHCRGNRPTCSRRTWNTARAGGEL